MYVGYQSSRLSVSRYEYTYDAERTALDTLLKILEELLSQTGVKSEIVSEGSGYMYDEAEKSDVKSIKPISVLIADDHKLISDIISSLLNSNGQFQVDAVGDLKETKQALSETHYDILMLDYVMPGMSGVNEIGKLLDIDPQTRIVIFSGNISESMVSSAIRKGACGYVPKNVPANALVSILSLVNSGEVFLPASFKHFEAEQAQIAENLTTMESEVLSRISIGQSNKEIARDLDITEVIVKMHVRAIFVKLDVRNRTQAALEAHRLSLV